MEKFEGKIATTTLDETKKRGEFRPYKSDCNTGYNVFYQKGNRISKVKNFLLCDTYKEGVTFSDGSKLLIQGWITVVRMGEYFQLLPMNGSFGFCNGLMGTCQVEKKLSEKTNTSVEVSYFLNGNIMYEVKTITIEASDFGKEIYEEIKSAFDLFDGQKAIAVIKKGGNKEGLIIANNLHICENFKIDPLVGQVLRLLA